MSEKKYVSLNRLSNYDTLIKAKIAESDSVVASHAESYMNTKISNMVGSSSVATQIANHNTSTSSHSDIRELIKNLTTKLNNFLDVDDTTSDQLSEVLTLIENNKGTLESLTTSKVNVSDIIDNLTTANKSKVLSANQGVVIKTLIDALQEELDSHTHSISDVTGLQSALDGKAASSHGTHVSYSSTAPVMDGTASVGAASTVARSDHRHPTDTSRAAQTELDSLKNVVAGKANSSHTHTIANITNLQTTLDGKAASSHTHTVANITDLTATATELNYMGGVTSNVQTQLDGKASSSHALSKNTDATASKSLSFGGTFTAVTDTAVSGHKITDTTTTFTMPSDRLFTTLVPTGTAIPANANLNTTTYLKVGRYYCSANKTVETLTNCPSSDAFMMEVYSPLSTTIDNETSKTWVYRLRELTTYTGTKYLQYCYAGATAGTWTYGAWTKFYMDKHFATSSAYSSGTKIGSITIDGDTTNYYMPSHNHDDKYYTETEVDTKLSGKADSSHTHTIANVTNLQSSLDAKQATVTGGASTITSSNLTASRALISNSSGKVAVSDVTSTELGYLDGVTSNVQTQLNAKAASSHTHTVANISDLTATATELNYMDGVTSSVQTQLNGKAASSHTHTKSQITDFPTSLKNPSALTIQGNGTTLTNGTYDGSAAKTVNITPSAIGAAASGHTHNYAGSSSAGGAATSANKLNVNAAGNPDTPVYFLNGVPSACNAYGGGTAVTLNGTSKGGSTASFYAPTASSVAGAICVSGGTGQSPSWQETLPIANGGTGSTTAFGALYNLGGITRKLLWTNASPTSSFTAQSIQLSLSDYTDIEIVYLNCSASGKLFLSTGMLASPAITGAYATALEAPYYTGGSDSLTPKGSYIRPVALSTSYVTFSKGFSVSTNGASAAADNTGCVPYAIYGSYANLT